MRGTTPGVGSSINSKCGGLEVYTSAQVKFLQEPVLFLFYINKLPLRGSVVLPLRGGDC